MKRKIISMFLAIMLLINMVAPISVYAANTVSESTEESSDMLATATYASSSWDWSGNGALSYDSNSNVTNGENSLRSWRFSTKAQSAYTYARIQINLNQVYDLTNKDLVFDIKSDPANELTSYRMGIILYDSNWQALSDPANYQEYDIYYTGDGWHTVTVDNSILRAYLLEGKSLSNVQLLYLGFMFPSGAAQNIYIDNMHLVDAVYGNDATDAAADLLANATVASSNANGTSLIYEHNSTAVAYGKESNKSHKFSAGANESGNLTVQYDLGKSYDLTGKNIVMDMLSFKAGNAFEFALYNSKKQLITSKTAYTTVEKWSEIRPDLLGGLKSGMNLSDVRYISISAKFADDTSRSDRALYVDNLRIENIDVHSTALQNKNIVFMGDSITASYGYKGWSGELQEHYLINKYNIGVGGASYATISDRTTIYQQISRIPSVDVDFFVLNGGVNDVWSKANLGSVSNISVANATVNSFDTNTTAGAMEQMFCYLTKNYPNAKVAFLINYICYNDSWDGVTFRDKFALLAKQICEKWGVSCLDMSTDTTFNGLYGVHTYDGVHGNDVGYEIIMRKMAPWLISLCDATEQTEQNSDLLAYATYAWSESTWNSGALSYDNASTDVSGSESLRSWKFSATSTQSANASVQLQLNNLDIFTMTGKKLQFDVKFEGAAQKIGIRLYDKNWTSVTGAKTVWVEGDGSAGWQTLTADASQFESVLASGCSLDDIRLITLEFDFVTNKGKAQTVTVDNFRVVSVTATEATEQASDLLYGAGFVEGSMAGDGLGFDQFNTTFLKGKDSKYSLRFFAEDDKTAWGTATFKLPKSIDLRETTLQFNVNQYNQAALWVDLYDSNYKKITGDNYTLRAIGWQTYEVNSLFGLESGRTAEDLKDVRYIKFSLNLEPANTGRTVVIDNLSTYSNVQYDSAISGLTGLYLGDSISEAHNYKGWPGEMAEHYGVNGYNVSVGGRTLANDGIYNELANAPKDMEFDFVMLNGVVNDYFASIATGTLTPDGTTTFDGTTAIGGLEKIFHAITTRYPDAEVVYILNFVPDWSSFRKTEYLNDFIPQAKKACEKWGVHCLDLVDNDPFLAEFDVTADVHTFDGLHPNKEGFDVITPYVVSFLESIFDQSSVEAYWTLEQDETVDLSLSEDLYVDLNGYTLSGIINTNGFNVYAIDSTTDKYTCDKMGYFTAKDSSGNAVVPVAHFRSYTNGTVKRYVTIETESGYTFHRFYVGITKQSLAPTVTGVGYKAVFCGDEMVQAIMDENKAYGYELKLEGYAPVSRSKDRDSFVSGKELTLRVNNFDVENHGETNLYATVWVKLNGEMIRSSEYTLTLRQMVETVNAEYESYSETQLQAVRDMITANPVMESWDVENLIKQVATRGNYFEAGEDFVLDVEGTEEMSTLSFDYRIVEGEQINIALMMPDWASYYGYYALVAGGTRDVYEGVTTTTLDDGYVHVSFDLNKINKIVGSPTKNIDFLFIRGAWSDAAGYIDRIQFSTQVDEPEPEVPGAEFEGGAFTANTDLTIYLDNEKEITKLTFDYKIDSGEYFHIALMPDWYNFFGYFKFNAQGTVDTYEGVTTQKLDNGYIRVYVDINAATKIAGTPSKVLTMVYVRGEGNWTNANGCIDNIWLYYQAEEPEPEVPGAEFEGGAFTANTDLTIYLDNEKEITKLTFDYKIDSGEDFNIALMPDWYNFFGYFNFNAQGTAYTYEGITTQKLDNGYIRVYVDMNAVTKIAGTPSKVLKMVYVRGDWTTANGSITNIRINESAYSAPRGENFLADVDKTIQLNNTETLSTVSFEYKIMDGTKFHIALMPDWSNFYGYFSFGVNGANDTYAGVTTEMLDDGYIRVTFDIAALTKIAGAPNGAVQFLYVRGSWTDADGYIDNVQIKTTAQPEAPSVDLSDATTTLYVEQGEEFVILNLSDLQLHDGQDPQYTYDVISQLVEKTQPDLITVLGDTAQDNQNYSATTNFANLVKYIDSFDIPWAPIFGNHDHDTYYPGYDSPKGVSDEWIMAQFASAQNCIFMEGPSSVDGCGNYIVHVKEQGTEKLIRALYFFDSLLTGVNETHVQFYRDAVAYTTELNGGETLESIVFLHIPLPEYGTVYSQQLAVDFADTVGTVNSSAPGSGTTEFFTAIKELGSTRNVIAGHEHDNAYYMTYEGVKLIYNMKSSDGDNYRNVASTGGGVFTIGETTQFHYEMASVEQEMEEATAFAMPMLANWQNSGKSFSFTFSATDTVTSGNTFSFVLCGSNPRRTSVELESRHGSWNRLTNTVTIDITKLTASLGTIVDNGDGTYTYYVKLADLPLNDAASEVAYGDETLKLVYFNTVSHSVKISDLCISVTEQSAAVRGQTFDATADPTYKIGATKDCETISFEYRITSGEYFHIALMPDWSNFYGYYQFTASGAASNYDGISCEILSDGYIRVTFDMAALTKIAGTPSAQIDFLYFRGGDWSDAAGYVDNISFTE